MATLDRKFASRRVLLLDNDKTRRDGRADQLRSRGVEVMCAADITEARLMWLENSFRLILVETQGSPEAVEFGREIRFANPKQLLAFFVGRPGYLSSTPSLLPLIGTEELTAADFAVRVERACELISHPNGFREASLRILAARYSMHRQRSSSAGKANGNA